MHGNNVSKNIFLVLLLLWDLPFNFLKFLHTLYHGSATTWCMGIWCPKGFFCSFVVCMGIQLQAISFVQFCSCIWHFLSFVNVFYFLGFLLMCGGNKSQVLSQIYQQITVFFPLKTKFRKIWLFLLFFSHFWKLKFSLFSDVWFLISLFWQNFASAKKACVHK